MIFAVVLLQELVGSASAAMHSFRHSFPNFVISLAPFVTVFLISVRQTIMVPVSAPNDDALLQRLIHIPRLSGEGPVFSISDAPYGCPNTTDMPSPRDDVLNLM